MNRAYRKLILALAVARITGRNWNCAKCYS